MFKPQVGRILIALLIVVGALRIASTLTTFSATVDEATHVGAGLELFEYRKYDLQFVNPPLTRIIMAAVPWWSGMRIDLRGSLDDQLHSVFYGRGDYIRNVALGRVGNLVFFILAAGALWFLTRQILGEAVAVLAVLLFTTQPVVLGYAGLATHDIAATAGLALALFAFSYWLQKPNLARAAILGAAWGVSILGKFAAIPFVPAACAGIYVIHLLHDREARRGAPRAVLTLLLVPITSFILIWAGYAFTVGSFAELKPWQEEFGRMAARVLVAIPPDTPLPAPRFFAGVGELLRLDRLGHQSYLFGQVSEKGWWWYFPAAVALKTPLGFLLLVGLGLFFARRWPFLEALAAAAAILAVSLRTTLDLGVRYVLPFYVPISVAAAAAAVAMLSDRRRLVKAIAVVAIVWHVGASLFAHPDYFSYFNAFAGRDPSRYLIDSNLDWGQDVLRLRAALRERKIEHIGLSLMGPADYDALGFPPYFHIHPWVPSQGWLAVSDHSYRMSRTQGGWRWLVGKPYTRIGKSIRLYRME